MLQCTHFERVEPRLPLVCGVWRQVGRRSMWVWLASCSLVVCSGTRTDSSGGSECPTGSVGGRPRNHTHDLQVSRGRVVICAMGRFRIHSSPGIHMRDKDTLPCLRCSRVWQKGMLPPVEPALLREQALFREISAGFWAPIVDSDVHFPFSWISWGRIQRMGWSRKCVHTAMARMGNKKWPHVWQDRCERTAVWSAQNGASVWHGSGARFKRMLCCARMWPCVRTVAQDSSWEDTMQTMQVVVVLTEWGGWNVPPSRNNRPQHLLVKGWWVWQKTECVFSKCSHTQ